MEAVHWNIQIRLKWFSLSVSFYLNRFFYSLRLLNESNCIHNNVHSIRNEAFFESDNKQSSEKYYVKCAIMVSNETSNLSFYLHLCGLMAVQFSQC